MEEITSQEIAEKLQVIQLFPSPYGSRGWLKCEISRESAKNIPTLRSVIEAYIILIEEVYSSRFSIDRFADALIKEIPAYAPQARKISISAYSSYKKINQREIQGAISRRITEKLNAECNFREYDTALRVTVLEKTAIATLDLEIQPANLPTQLETHPTPILPPIAYCMIRLTRPQKNEQFLDPMCGYGTIPLMAALEWEDLRIRGSDISSDYIDCAKRNAAALGVESKVEFIVSDIGNLPYKEVESNIIALNPPYGIAIPLQNQMEQLYDTIFAASSNILLDQGRLAIITPYPHLIEEASQKSDLTILNALTILEGELPRTIHILGKL